MTLARRKPLPRTSSLETRAPLKRKARLERGKPLRAKRWGIRAKTPKRVARRAELSPRTQYVKAQPCINCGRRGPCDPAHITLSRDEKGMGMKVDDRQIVPLCRRCHRQWDTHSGQFDRWNDVRRYSLGRAWVVNISERWALYITPESEEHGRHLEALGLGTMGVNEKGQPCWTPGVAA